MVFNPFKKKTKFILDESPGERTSRLSRIPTVRPMLKREGSRVVSAVKGFVSKPAKPAKYQNEYQIAYNRAVEKETKREARKNAIDDYRNSRKSGFQKFQEKGKKYVKEVKENSSRIAKSGVALSRASPLDEFFLR